VRTAASVAEALSVLRTWPADIVVGGIGLRDDDGSALLSKIHELDLSLGRKTSVIGLRSQEMKEGRDTPATAGRVIELPKAVELRELLSTFARVASRSGTRGSLDEDVAVKKTSQ
jgi:hypothetical protein